MPEEPVILSFVAIVVLCIIKNCEEGAILSCKTDVKVIPTLVEP